MTTPEPSVPVQSAVRRRARWPWIAATAAVLAAVGAEPGTYVA